MGLFRPRRSVAHALLARDYAELRTTGWRGGGRPPYLASSGLSRRPRPRRSCPHLWRAMRLYPQTTARGCFRFRVLSRAPARTVPEGFRFLFNAFSLTTGVRFGFERDVVGDWVIG